MLLPEFCEELFYSKNINLFETNFKNYLEKVYNYNILETIKWIQRLYRYKNYTIKEFKKLTYFSCYNNNLTYIPNLNLPNLQELYLSYNQLTSFQPLTLNIPNLKFLHISYNQLTEIPNLIRFPNLEMLSISNNQLTKISNLNHTNLQRLYIYNNQLTEISALNLPNLQLLDLNNNSLTNESKKYVRSLKINYLYL